MQSDTVILKGWEFLTKLNIVLNDQTIALLNIHPNDGKTYSTEILEVNVYAAFIPNPPKLEADKMFFHRRMDQWTVAHPYTEIGFSDKK